MKVLLISANTLTEPYPVYPLGLDYVAGAIAADHQVQIVDMNSIRDYDSLGEIIRQFSPDVIGISLRNIDNTDATDERVYRSIQGNSRSDPEAFQCLAGFGWKRIYHFSCRVHKCLECRLRNYGRGRTIGSVNRCYRKTRRHYGNSRCHYPAIP